MVNVRVISEEADFREACSALAAGEGPLAIDAERASGFTYSQKAYLVQIHRRNSGTFLFDPPAIGDMSPIMHVAASEEFVLHAASQDLACLREVGIDPTRIFDTELSARLLGLERVGLGAVVQELLNVHLAKEHSAADWSTRPLPDAWLTYAALDVEHLVDLRDILHRLLSDAGKLDWAHQEFQATLEKPEKPAPTEPWRVLSGIHAVKSQRQLAVARALWIARDTTARERNIAPRRLIPDASIIAAARANHATKSSLARAKDFHGAASRSLLDTWWNAIQVGLHDDDLPALRVPTDALPPPRAWAERKPEAAARLQASRDALATRAEELNLPLENLLPPALLRELCWHAPDGLDLATIGEKLASLGARDWQVELCSPVISSAFAPPLD